MTERHAEFSWANVKLNRITELFADRDLFTRLISAMLCSVFFNQGKYTEYKIQNKKIT